MWSQNSAIRIFLRPHFLPVLCLLGSVAWLSVPAYGQSLKDAESEFLGHRIDKALEAYKVVVDTSDDPADRAEAAAMAALIEWRYYQKHDEAAELLEAALAGGCDKVGPLLALSRLELDRKRYEDARAAAERALKHAKTTDEKRRARIQYARAVVQEYIDAVRQGKDLGDTKLLTKVESDLAALGADHEDFMDSSRLLLRAAILLGDGKQALQAWHSYFGVAPGEQAYGVLRDSQKELVNTWPAWHGDSASPETQFRLIRALAGSRLYKEAVILAGRYGVGDEAPDEIKDVLVYGRAMWDLEEFINEQYRGYFGGGASPSSFLQGFVERICALWNQSSWATGPCPVPVPFNPQDPEALAAGQRVMGELFERFGTTTMMGSQLADVYMGHAIIEEPREINQYGQRAKITYVLVDSMVSDGWQDWATDGRVRAGGYVPMIENQFAQVRQVYAHEPLAAWDKATDPEKRKELEERIARDSKEDWSRTKEDPYAYLPGLAGRLDLAGYDQVLGHLKKQGLQGDGLRRAFIAQVEEAKRESVIFAHEGRHVIDKRMGFGPGAELEFRGKLSQVAFAPIPRLAFGGLFIDPAATGAESPHGRANRRIMQGIVAWMKAHLGEIAGLDADKPMLPQFDLLTDEQMRDVMRSMDPLLKGEATPAPSGGAQAPER
jgi:tetratricopeptide (TPR) repeat protein